MQLIPLYFSQFHFQFLGQHGLGLIVDCSHLNNAARDTVACIAGGPTARRPAVPQIVLSLVYYHRPANDVLRGVKQGDDVVGNVNRGG